MVSAVEPKPGVPGMGSRSFFIRGPKVAVLKQRDKTELNRKASEKWQRKEKDAGILFVRIAGMSWYV
jgi:hypothetical protein